MSNSLSPALEDYLKAILHLSEDRKTVKISEIARKLNITKPSVNQAVGILKNEGYVFHETYGPVVLTEKGHKKAHEVCYRHKTIRQFLSKVLKVSASTADSDACLMEHILSAESFEKMEEFLKHYDSPAISGKAEHPEALTLNDLLPGDKARVKKVSVKETRLRQRLLDMGIAPGVEIEVKRVAPLGDPIEIEIRGFYLSLRRSEAAGVIVEKDAK